MNSPHDDASANRRGWDAAADAYQERHGGQLARTPEAWGVWSLPEAEMHLLGDVSGRDVLEYGCGGAQWSIALARRGARCTGLDNSQRQLAHARQAVDEAGVDVRLVHASAEATPFEDASFDVVFCDHGAMSFAAPERTIPEVARILRPGGAFVFNVEHPIHACTWGPGGNVTRTLHRSYFELERWVDPDDGIVSHNRTISSYVALLLQSGFQLERLIEPRPGSEATTTYDAFAPPEIARDVPAELIVRALRRPHPRRE